MRKAELGILFTACMLSTACTQNEENAQVPVPIGFTTGVSAQTREYSSENLPAEMGVFTYFTHGSLADNLAAATPNYMYNRQVTRDASTGTWDYNPVLYWPINDDDKLSFFAYAPYTDEKVTGTNPTVSSTSTTIGYPTLTYTLPADEATEPIDLLIASLIDQTYTGGAVRFNFKHALVKIQFSLWNADTDGTTKTVTQMSLKSSRSGTLVFTPDGGKWTGSTSNLRVHDFITTADTPKELAADYGSEVKLGSTLAVADQTTASISFVYKMTVDGAEKTYTVTDRALPATTIWTPGSTIGYSICLKKNWVEILASTSSVWTPSDVEDSPTIVVPQ